MHDLSLMLWQGGCIQMLSKTILPFSALYHMKMFNIRFQLAPFFPPFVSCQPIFTRQANTGVRFDDFFEAGQSTGLSPFDLLDFCVLRAAVERVHSCSSFRPLPLACYLARPVSFSSFPCVCLRFLFVRTLCSLLYALQLEFPVESVVSVAIHYLNKKGNEVIF